MIPAFIIAFREVLEISIILTIVLAATRGVAGRIKWILTGMAGGIAGSVVVAVFAESISNSMEGYGQEIFNAAILFIAILMIIWTVVWMQSHGRAISEKIKKVGKAVVDGEKPLYSIAVVVSLAMWREGAEIVMFMTGILSTSEEAVLAILSGGVAGAALAGVLGILLYYGLIKLSSKHLFKVSGWLLILLACGMSAQMASYLAAADMLPEFGQLWDTSWLLAENSLLGKILNAMLGYSDRPSGIQLLFYIVTMFFTLGLIRLNQSKKML